MSSRERIGIILLCLAICFAGLFVERVLEYRRLSARPSDLYEVVRQEIDAVREADYARAYRQASSSFQERFNIEAFADLTRSVYPVGDRIERIEFGRVVHDGRTALVQVYLFLPGGDIVPCIYSLVNEDSVWKIDATHVQKRWPSTRRLGGLRS